MCPHETMLSGVGVKAPANTCVFSTVEVLKPRVLLTLGIQHFTTSTPSVNSVQAATS